LERFQESLGDMLLCKSAVLHLNIGHGTLIIIFNHHIQSSYSIAGIQGGEDP